MNGGLFQVGTEDAPFQHDFDLTLEGDDPGNDVDVAALVASSAAKIVRAVGATHEDDTIEGTELGETIAALTGNDTLTMGTGDDHVDLGWGDDSADGGAGEDTLSFASLSPPNLEINGFTFGAVVDLGRQGTAQQTGQGTDTFTGFEHLEGSEFNDGLFGDDGDNRIEGLDGRDFLTGGAGADTLLGGAAFDVLDGGSGADTLFGGTTGGGAIEADIAAYFEAEDPLVFSFGTSISQLLAGSSPALLDDVIGPDIEGVAGATAFSNTFLADQISTNTFFLGGAESDTFFGGSGTDQLLGVAGDDVMYGNDGQDALIGEGGNDQFWTGGADGFADFIFLDGINEGHDTIHDLELGLDVIFFTGGNIALEDVTFGDTDADGNGVNDALITYIGGGVTQTITVIDIDAATVETEAIIEFG